MGWPRVCSVRKTVSPPPPLPAAAGRYRRSGAGVAHQRPRCGGHRQAIGGGYTVGEGADAHQVGAFPALVTVRKQAVSVVT